MNNDANKLSDLLSAEIDRRKAIEAVLMKAINLMTEHLGDTDLLEGDDRPDFRAMQLLVSAHTLAEGKS